MELDESGFYNQLLDYNNILYLCHRNADPDALGSAFALKEAIGGTIGVVDGCDRVASQIAGQLNIEYVLSPKGDYDFVVVVDTSTPAQLNGFPTGFSVAPSVISSGSMSFQTTAQLWPLPYASLFLY